MAFAGMIGSHVDYGKIWNTNMELSGDAIGSVPPGEYTVDPFLPTLSVDPYNPARAITLPMGRFVAVGTAAGVQAGGNTYAAGLATAGKTPLTLCDGYNLKPQGMSISNMYRDDAVEFGAGVNTVKYRKGFLAAVPFVLAVNNAHGTTFSGDYVTGYWGSTSSTTTKNYAQVGKPVLWNARRVRSVNGTASAMFQLSSTSYPGMAPRIIAVQDNAGAALNPTASLGYNSTFGLWVASFTGTGSGSVSQIWYDYGQDTDMRGGRVQRIRSLSDMLSTDTYTKWVEYAQTDFLNFPPAAQGAAETQVTNETPSTVTSGSEYRLQHYPASLHHAVTVQINNATLTDASGTQSSITDWYTLPTTAYPTQDARGYFIGNYHTVNWRTGLIELSSNIVAGGSFAIRVSYSYYTDWRLGAVLWGGGIDGQTDGRNITLGSTASAYGSATVTPSTNAYGTPSHLNLSDVVGELRLWVD